MKLINIKIDFISFGLLIASLILAALFIIELISSLEDGTELQYEYKWLFYLVQFRCPTLAFLDVLLKCSKYRVLLTAFQWARLMKNRDVLSFEKNCTNYKTNVIVEEKNILLRDKNGWEKDEITEKVTRDSRMNYLPITWVN